MRSIQKAGLFCFTVCVVWLLHAPAYACDGSLRVTTHCGYSKAKESHPTSRGCNTLEVIIHNDTAYEFVVDDTYQPSALVGDTSAFETIPQTR